MKERKDDRAYLSHIRVQSRRSSRTQAGAKKRSPASALFRTPSYETLRSSVKP